MTLNSSMENRNILFQSLKQMINDWHIIYRIRQKIQTWDVRYREQKIESVPQPFFVHAFTYYILKHCPSLIEDYSQDILMETNLKLKNCYNGLFIDYFKSEQNFNFTMVVLSKLLKYFLITFFGQNYSTEKIQSHIFSSIITAIIGYPIDPTAYKIILKKLNKNTIKKRLSLLAATDDNIKLNLNKTLEKKMHRQGRKGLAKIDQSDHRRLQFFRLQVHAALQTKGGNSSNYKKQKQNSYQLKKQFESISPHQRTTFQRLNPYQISSAMSVNEGFQILKRSVPIHLSIKKISDNDNTPSIQISRKNSLLDESINTDKLPLIKSKRHLTKVNNHLMTQQYSKRDESLPIVSLAHIVLAENRYDLNDSINQGHNDQRQKIVKFAPERNKQNLKSKKDLGITKGKSQTKLKFQQKYPKLSQKSISNCFFPKLRQ